MKPKRYRWMTISLLLAMAMGVFLWPARLSASGQAGREWRVWMKVSPCSGRTDWVSVATENPTTGGGGPFFEQFPGSHAWATFAEAMAEANALRGSSLFSNYCCKNYRVFRNSATGKLTVVVGLYGNPGGGFTEQEGGPMCCEDAAAMAGYPASFCGGGGGSVNTCFANDPGMASTNRNDHYDWAQRQDPAHLEANLKNKINLLFNCPSVTDDQLSSAFADYSVIIARYAQNAACFSGDRGVINTDWSAHKAWARAKSRSQLLSNLQWKMAAAFKCLDRASQSSFFADSSVATAKAALAGGSAGSGSSGGSGGGRGGSGGSGGGSGGAGGTTSPGRLQLVEVKQDPPCSTWGNITSCNPNGGQITWGPSVNTNYQWTSPPQQVGPEGFTITMSVSEQNPPERRSATGLNMTGGGFVLDPPNPTIPIGAPNQPMSGSLTVTVKPPKNPSGDYYLKIGVYWGPGFTYHYRVVR